MNSRILQLDCMINLPAEITYQFEDMTIDVPSGTNSEDSARWKVDGKVSISTKEHKES